MCPTSSQQRSVATKRRTDSGRPDKFDKTLGTGPPQKAKRKPSLQVVIAIVISVAAAAFLSRGLWLPKAGQFLGSAQESPRNSQDKRTAATGDHAADAHAMGMERMKGLINKTGITTTTRIINSATAAHAPSCGRIPSTLPTCRSGRIL